MNGLRQRPFRVVFRLLWLAGELTLAMLDYVVNVVFQRQMSVTRAQALWLQQASRRILRILSVEIQSRGPVPLQGLLVCNHLSYLDILVISAVTPSLFISKSEVKRWPIFGWFARVGGSLFVDRTKRADVARLNQDVARVLAEGALIVLFPEGTSTDGQQVLPFKSSLLEPVSRLNPPLTVGCLQYRVADGSPGEDVCYWGEMTLVPHLVNLMSKRWVKATVAFTKNGEPVSCRKTLARHLHSEVTRLKDSEIHSMAE